MYNIVHPCTTTYNLVQHCENMYNSVKLCTTIYYYVCTCMTDRQHYTYIAYRYVQFCTTSTNMCIPVQHCINMYIHAQVCTTLLCSVFMNNYVLCTTLFYVHEQLCTTMYNVYNFV